MAKNRLSQLSPSESFQSDGIHSFKMEGGASRIMGYSRNIQTERVENMEFPGVFKKEHVVVAGVN